MSKERLEQALSNWQEKLAEYEYELSIACSPAEKFYLKKIIEECWEEIRRIETKIRSFQVPSNEEFFKPYRVLVVEDDEVNRDLITLALEEEGYEVEKTGHPRKALDLLVHKPRFNLILLDLMLPEINGLDLCRFLRARGDPIMILIITVKSSETDLVLGLEVGADDYLTKPFSTRELVARCRALLRRQSFTIR